MNDYQNIYVPWSPLGEWPNEIYFESLFLTPGRLKITLRKQGVDGMGVDFVFCDYISHMVSDENCHMKFMQNQPIGKWSPTYIVDKSSYIEYLHEQSFGIYKNENLIHVAIYTPIECIDVVSKSMPDVAILEK